MKKFSTFNKEVNEGKSGFVVQNPSYSAAIDQVIKFAEKNGYSISDEEVFQQISTGPTKPKAGKTNRFSLELMKGDKVQKKALQVQIYGQESGMFELNMYIS